MSGDRLDQFVRKQLALGFTKPEIKQMLAKQGVTDIGQVDSVRDSYTEIVAQQRKRLAVGSAVVLLVLAGAAILAFSAYEALHTPTVGEITRNLSKEYGPIATVPVEDLGMEPALPSGGQALVATDYYLTRKIERADVIAITFRLSNQTLIRRVTALPGEKVNPSLFEGILYQQLSYYGFVIPPDMFLILADNQSTMSLPGAPDSRTFGLVPLAYLSGKAVN